MKAKRKLTEAAVADYWLKHDSTDEIDWTQPGVKLEFDPDAERPTQSVTVHLPRQLIREIHVIAKDRDVPYKALLKMLLAEKVAELRKRSS